jgi:hypothetical protein
MIPDVDGDGRDDGTLNSPCTGPALPAPNALRRQLSFTPNSDQRDSNGDSAGRRLSVR